MNVCLSTLFLLLFRVRLLWGGCFYVFCSGVFVSRRVRREKKHAEIAEHFYRVHVSLALRSLRGISQHGLCALCVNPQHGTSDRI